MKILIDINHPAHVHFFKNFIWEAEKLGHEIAITATKKDIAFRLLDDYGFQYHDMGTYGKKIWQKFLNIPVKDFALWQIACKFKPDLMMGIASHRICHAGTVLGIPTFVFDDTEHATLEIMIYRPFATRIFTPECFYRNLGPKQFRYSGYHELAYLHPNRFVPDENILKEAGLEKSQIFSIVRFVSWNASHDIGQKGISQEQKEHIVEKLEKFGQVIITSEKELPGKLEKYRLRISPAKIHHLINYASLVYGESATMASEAAVLGVHSVFCDFNGRSYTDEEEKKYNLVSNFRLDATSIQKSIDRAVELLSDPNLKTKGQTKRKKLLDNKIDVTDFMLKQAEDLFKN